MWLWLRLLSCDGAGGAGRGCQNAAGTLSVSAAMSCRADESYCALGCGMQSPCGAVMRELLLQAGHRLDGAPQWLHCV